MPIGILSVLNSIRKYVDESISKITGSSTTFCRNSKYRTMHTLTANIIQNSPRDYITDASLNLQINSKRYI